MKAFFVELRAALSDINHTSRRILKYGMPVVYAMYVLALLAYAARSFGDYYALSILCSDALECGKECLGAVAVPALLLEILSIANGKTQCAKK